MTLTVSDRERHAYVNGDAQTLALIEQIALEADDVPVRSDELIAHVEGRETSAWCLEKIGEAPTTARPPKKSQMRLLAVELEGSVCRLPRKGREELDPVYRAFGLQE